MKLEPFLKLPKKLASGLDLDNILLPNNPQVIDRTSVISDLLNEDQNESPKDGDRKLGQKITSQNFYQASSYKKRKMSMDGSAQIMVNDVN